MKMKYVATLPIALAGAIAAGTAFAGWSVIAVQDAPGPGWSSWGWTHNYAGQGEAINEAVRICSEGGGACRYLFFNEKKCISYAESRAGGWWYGWAYGSNRSSVQDKAVEGCAAGAPPNTCRVLLIAC
jgi:hypothetical protein